MNVWSTQDTIPPPPGWAKWFRSDDLDEVRQMAARVDGEHSRVAHGSGPLGFESAVINGETCEAGWGRTALPVTIRGALPNAVLHLGVPAGTRYRLGRREYLTESGDSMFVPGGWEFTRRGIPGALLAIAPDADRLLEEIAVRGADKPGRLLLTARRLTIGHATFRRLSAALDGFVHATAPGGDLRAARRSEADLLAAVADILLEGSAVLPTREATSARIADVEAWIEANLDRPITAGQLCRVAGVCRRGLEKAFESRRGMSPMRFVAERRLAAAHCRLVRPGPNDDVTTTAQSVGFSHMGRFSSLYRQAFGESPSESLKRARRRQM